MDHDETAARRTLAAAAVVLLLVGGALLVLRTVPSSAVSGTWADDGPSAGDRLGAADGVVGAGVTVLDDDPAVTRLDPGLLAALRTAAADAATDGVPLVVNSGWRSAAYQQQLLDEAVATYGSVQEAARWVATPETSPHVSGDAVDLAPAGAAWVARHGAAYGLCRVYANEPWHLELRPAAVGRGCPELYADPTQDPRMRAG